MMDNIYIRTDPAGNIKPDKEKSTEKIDGAVAAADGPGQGYPLRQRHQRLGLR